MLSYALVFPDIPPGPQPSPGLLFPYVPEDSARHERQRRCSVTTEDVREGRKRASRAVSAELSSQLRNPADLARETGLDTGTVGDFLSGKRWMRTKNRGLVEAALGWAPGTLERIAEGEDPRVPAGAPEEDLSLEAARERLAAASQQISYVKRILDHLSHEADQ